MLYSPFPPFLLYPIEHKGFQVTFLELLPKLLYEILTHLKSSTCLHRTVAWSIQHTHQVSITRRRTMARGSNGEIKHGEGLPWWHSGWESACQCRGHGFEPWSGKIPHAAEQLGLWATTTEPAHLEPVLRNKRGRDSERPTHRNEEWPPLAATRESPRTETKTQHSQK